MAESGAREMVGEDLEFIEAEFITIRQSNVRALEGGHVEAQQVGALSIDGERVEVTQGAAAVIRGSEVNLNQSISLITTGNNTEVNSSLVPVLLSRDGVVVERSAVGIMGAGTIKADNASSLLMIANTVEGNVTTLLDWRSALALGAVIGGALGFLSLFRRR
jgi:hypothetical protein